MLHKQAAPFFVDRSRRDGVLTRRTVAETGRRAVDCFVTTPVAAPYSSAPWCVLFARAVSHPPTLAVSSHLLAYLAAADPSPADPFRSLWRLDSCTLQYTWLLTR